MEDIRKEFTPYQAETILGAFMTLSAAGTIQVLESLNQPVDYKTKFVVGIVGLATVGYALLSDHFFPDASSASESE